MENPLTNTIRRIARDVPDTKMITIADSAGNGTRKKRMKQSNYKICNRCRFSYSDCTDWNKKKSLKTDYCDHMEFKENKDTQKEREQE